MKQSNVGSASRKIEKIDKWIAANSNNPKLRAKVAAARDQAAALVFCNDEAWGMKTWEQKQKQAKWQKQEREKQKSHSKEAVSKRGKFYIKKKKKRQKALMRPFETYTNSFGKTYKVYRLWSM